MNNQFFSNFKAKHPIVTNAILILLAFWAICYASLLAIDIFTAHGQQKKVPDVRQLPIDQAIAKLEDAGFKWAISDSIYNDQFKPGAVIDQNPKPNTYVKAIRTIYLSLNALSPRTVPLPVLTEISIRQGLSMLQSMGFKNIQVDTVPSEYESLILKVTVNGHEVKPGTHVTINSVIKLTMGDGSITDINPDSVLDSRTIDSLENKMNAKKGEEEEILF